MKYLIDLDQVNFDDFVRRKVINLSFSGPVYFKTAKTYTDAVDIIDWHGFGGILCGQQLRDHYGHLVDDGIDPDDVFKDFTLLTNDYFFETMQKTDQTGLKNENNLQIP